MHSIYNLKPMSTLHRPRWPIGKSKSRGNQNLTCS